MLDDLDKFSRIGWDFDETLIEHHNSSNIQEYIKNNPQKKHYIITFRTHYWATQIWEDLASFSGGLDQTNFAGVFNMSDKAWEDYQKVIFLKKHRMKYGPSPAEIYYKEWKGLICHQNNIPVLVDDRRNEVILGCEKFGIVYMHPNDLYA